MRSGGRRARIKAPDQPAADVVKGNRHFDGARQLVLDDGRVVEGIGKVLAQLQAGRPPGRIDRYAGAGGPEFGPLEAAADGGVFHKSLPDLAGAVVFDHDGDGALIDADDVGGPPFSGEIKGVAKAVAAPEVGAIGVVEMAQRRQADLRRKGDRAAHGGRGDGAVVVLGRRRAARRIAGGAVAGGDAPDLFAIAGPAFGIGDAVGLLGQGGAARVFEIVAPLLAHIVVLDAAEIDPAVAELVAEEGRKDHIGLAVLGAPVVAAAPGGPG